MRCSTKGFRRSQLHSQVYVQTRGTHHAIAKFLWHAERQHAKALYCPRDCHMPANSKPLTTSTQAGHQLYKPRPFTCRLNTDPLSRLGKRSRDPGASSRCTRRCAVAHCSPRLLSLPQLGDVVQSPQPEGLGPVHVERQWKPDLQGLAAC